VLRTSAQLRHDVIDGVAHGLQIGEIFVLDAESDAALAQFFFKGFNQFNQRKAVGVEVVGEGITLVNGSRLGLEDVG